MAKRRGGSRRGGEEWRRLIAEFEEKGEGIDEFCRRHGIHPPTMRWWQWRLKGSAAGVQAKVSSQSRKQPKPTFETVRFATTERASRATSFELAWADGLTLRIPEGFDESSLRRLVRVLEEAEC